MTLTIEERLHQQIDIKNRLELAGYTLRDIDRLYKLPKISASRTLYEPNLPAEEAIAAALGVKAHTLWKERYDQVTSLRHSPQPPENYERLPTVAQRRNVTDQLTPVKRTRRKVASDQSASFAGKKINKRTFGSKRQAVQS